MNSIYKRGDSFTERVAEVSRNIQEIKSAQNVGASSIILYNNQTSNAWDIIDTFSFMNFQALWRVTFTPSTPGATYAEIGVDWQITGGLPGFDNVYSFDDPSDAAGSSTKSFMVGLIPINDNGTIYLKFNIRSSSPGNISWVRIE